MKEFAKDFIKFKDSTKRKIGIYSVILGIANISLGLILIILGILDFLGVELIPIWFKYLRNPEYAPIFATILFPQLGNYFSLLTILTQIFPRNKAFVFVWETPTLIYDIIQPNIFLGLILAIIGIIFLSGVSDLLKLKDIGISHMVVGVLISLGIGIIYLLIFFAHGALFLLGNPDYYSWKPIIDFGPAIWLAFPSIPGGIIAWQIKDVK